MEAKIFRLQFDDQGYFIEAGSMAEAISSWKLAMREEHGADWHDDEEPDSCQLIDDKAFIRTIRAINEE